MLFFADNFPFGARTNWGTNAWQPCTIWSSTKWPRIGTWNSYASGPVLWKCIGNGVERWASEKWPQIERVMKSHEHIKVQCVWEKCNGEPLVLCPSSRVSMCMLRTTSTESSPRATPKISVCLCQCQFTGTATRFWFFLQLLLDCKQKYPVNMIYVDHLLRFISIL